MTREARTTVDVRTRRVAGALGLAAVLLVFGTGFAVPMLPPGADASDAALAVLVDVLRAPVAQLLAAAMTLGTLVWLVFAVALLVDTARGAWSWRRIAAAALATAFTVLAVLAQTSTSAFPPGPVSADVVRYAFAQGNIAFANSWLAFGAFGVLLGWDALADRGLPRWSAWWLLLAGALMMLARFTYPSVFWFFPYAAEWVWVIVYSVLALTRRRDRAAVPAGS